MDLSWLLRDVTLDAPIAVFGKLEWPMNRARKSGNGYSMI